MTTSPLVQPTLSPFVKGLIKSMQDSPQDWTYEEESGGMPSGWVILRWKHTSSIAVSGWSYLARDKSPRWSLDIYWERLSQDEREAINIATKQHLVTYKARREQEQRANDLARQNATFAEVAAPFERLGDCP